VAVEVSNGNTADPATLTSQVEKLEDRFGISRIVLVGDRGMITSARIGADLKPAGVDWITCLRAPAAGQGQPVPHLGPSADMLNSSNHREDELTQCRTAVLAWDSSGSRRRPVLLDTTCG
jgi:hypothetical protein